jgi:hypothetical protein
VLVFPNECVTVTSPPVFAGTPENHSIDRQGHRVASEEVPDVMERNRAAVAALRED